MKKIILSVMLLSGAWTLSAQTDAKTGATPTQQETSQKKSNIATVVFQVDLHCQSCVNKINNSIPFEKGVKDVACSLEKKTVTITYNPQKNTKEGLAKALDKLGYKATEKSVK